MGGTGLEGRPLRDPRPLAGWTVAVMRAREQAGELVRLLEARGASVRVLPMIRIEPPADPEPLRRAVRSVGSFDWVVFLSVNGVEGFWRELDAAGLDAKAFAASRVACVGPGTAAALVRRGVEPAVVPEEYVAEALLEALARADTLLRKRVLLPRGAGGRPVLPEGLRALGAEVTEVEAYRTVPEAEHAGELRELLRAGAVDALVFTSPSTVDSFVRSVGADPGRALVAAIGPVTAQAAAARGLAVHVCAEEHSVTGLVEALASRAAEERRRGRRV